MSKKTSELTTKRKPSPVLERGWFEPKSGRVIVAPSLAEVEKILGNDLKNPKQESGDGR